MFWIWIGYLLIGGRTGVRPYFMQEVLQHAGGCCGSQLFAKIRKNLYNATLF